MDEMGFYVSQNLHHDSIRNIFFAPMSFFDTTVSASLNYQWKTTLEVFLAHRADSKYFRQRY